MEKNLNTRIQFKNDSEENWLKAQDFIPMRGEMIIYNTDNNSSKNRIKIGNGNSSLSDLTFINNQPINNNYIDALFNGYLNYVPISTEANSKLIYNNTGYKEGYRLSSSGAEKTQANTVVTGFIPAKPNDIIRMKGAIWGTEELGGYSYIIYYDKNYQLLATVNRFRMSNESGVSNATTGKIDKTNSTILTDENGVTTFNVVFKTNVDYHYIRISATGKGADMIITKNELID